MYQVNAISFDDIMELVSLLGGNVGATKLLKDLREEKFRLERILEKVKLVRAGDLNEKIHQPIGNIAPSLRKWPQLVPTEWRKKEVLFLGYHCFSEDFGKYYHEQFFTERGEVSFSGMWRYETIKEHLKKDPDTLVAVIPKRRD